MCKRFGINFVAVWQLSLKMKRVGKKISPSTGWSLDQLVVGC